MTPSWPRTTAGPGWWCDRAWPVVAGTTTAVGLVGFAETIGWPAAALMGGCVWLLVSLAVYSTFGKDFAEPGSGSGIGVLPALHLGLVSAIATVALLGLGNLSSPVVGVAVAALVAVTSPPVVGRARARWQGARPALGPRPTPQPGQAEVDAAFAALVSELEEDI